MTHKIETKTSTGITFTVQIPYADIEKYLPKAAERLSQETTIEGFRKGKAPYDVIKQKFGEFKILEESARNFIERNYTKMLEDIEDREYKGTSFEPVGTPSISVTKLAPGEDVEYRIQLHVLPSLTLPDYRAIAKRVFGEKKAAEVTSDEIASAIKWLRESRVKRISVLRSARTGDRVEVDFSITMGGIPIEGGVSKNHPFILGDIKFMPGFEDALIGMKTGDAKEFSLELPQDWRDASIAGKKVDIKAEMKAVEERELPEWNDAFVQSLGGFSSAKEAEKSIKDGMITEKEAKAREERRMTMIDEVATGIRADIPAPLLERELEKMLAELNQSIERMGLKFEDYLTHIKKTTDDLKREWHHDARKRVLIALALREIAKRESLEPTDEDIERTKSHTIARLGLDEQNLSGIDPARGSGWVDREAFLAYNRGIARNEKVFEFLESLVTGT